MNAGFKEGDIVARVPVYIREHTLQDVELVVDNDSPDGFWRVEVMQKDIYGRPQYTGKADGVPVRASFVDEQYDDVDGVWTEVMERVWGDFELAEPPTDAQPIVLFQK